MVVVVKGTNGDDLIVQNSRGPMDVYAYGGDDEIVLNRIDSRGGNNYVEAGSGNDSAAIVSAIIKLGHSLGMTVVAEGIETRRQAVFLKSHGCTIGQGFLFGRPAPKAVVEELLMGTRKIA